MRNLKQTIEANNRKIFSLERETLHLAEENKIIKVCANKNIDDLEDFIREHEKGVSRSKKNLEITILEKEDFIKCLQQKLKAKEDPNPTNEGNNLAASQSEEQDDEIFLADKDRWENMGTYKEKRIQKHCSLDPRGLVDCTFQCYSKGRV